MRSFIALAVLYTAFAAATPIPQINTTPISLKQVMDLVDATIAARQLSGIPAAVAPLKQEIGETATGAGLSPALTTVDQTAGSGADDEALERRQNPLGFLSGLPIIGTAATLPPLRRGGPAEAVSV